MSRKAAVAGVFDRAAATYDAVGVPYFTVLGRKLVDAVGVHPGDRVLDVGCGRGAVLRPALEAAGPTGRVVGLDLAPGMVEATAREVADVPHALVVLADAEHPPAAGRSYDAVLSGLCLFFLPDPLGALGRWHQALRPGGRLGVSTFAGDDERWKGVADVFSSFAAAPDARPSRDGGTRPWDSDDGMADLLRQAGFEHVRSTVVPHVAVFADERTWLAWTRSHGQRAAWERIPGDRHTDAERALLLALQDLRDDDGAFRLHVAVRLTTAVRPAS